MRWTARTWAGGAAVYVLAAWSAVGCTGPGGGGDDDAGTDEDDAGVVDEQDAGGAFGATFRTLVYRELTAETVRVHERSVSLSADGSTAAYTTLVGNEIRVWVMPTDGSAAPTMIDSYVQQCGCEGATVMTADGTIVASTEGVQIRVVDGDGGGMMGGVDLTDGWLGDMAFADDGTLFFSMYRDDGSTNGPIERGIWQLDLASSTPVQLVGPQQAATALGATIDLVQFFSLAGPTLGASADGARLVFGVPVNGVGDHLVAYTVASDSIQLLVGPIGSAQTAGPGIRHGSLSADGQLVAYEAGNTPGVVDPSEWGVIPFSGGTKTVLTTSPPNPGVTNFSFAPLSADGSRLLLGDIGDLYETDDGEVLQLPVRGAFFSVDPLPITDGTTWQMSASGDAFLFTRHDAVGVSQLASMKLDPTNVGDAPSITSPTVDRATLPRDGTTTATIRASVSGAGIVRVTSATLRDGRRDTASNCLAGEVVMLDDGMNGDATAGDGVFTSPGIYASSCTPTADFVLRVKVESNVGGKRLATAVDFATLTIVEP